jgi:mannose-6-phosphate isomerase
MFVGLTNTPRDYAWGSTTAIADLLDRKPSGEPEAEYWLGTHPGSPSVLTDGPTGGRLLSDLVQLPFIMKVLAAETPVSLQAHPSTRQAEEGFARENEQAIPLDAPNRNYKDRHHKPEMIYALSDPFDALCGFRPVAATREVLAPIAGDPLVAALLERLTDDSSLREVFEWLITRGDGVTELLARVVELAPGQPGVDFATVVSLDRDYPGDPGILISLLLNHATVRPGEAVFLPAGNIHSYLHGLGIEVLASSDNVLRGGLTHKFVDVPELLRILDFRPLPVPFLEPDRSLRGVTLFRPDVPEFELAVIEPSAAGGSVEYAVPGDFVALAVRGSITLGGGAESRTLQRGDAVYGTADASPVTVTGDGTLFLTSADPHPPRHRAQPAPA